MTGICRRVLITGGSRGIGAGLVRSFAEAGYDVYFTYKSAADKAGELQAELTGKGFAVTSKRVDLERVAEIEELISDTASKEFDVLVNNAAVLKYVDFLTAKVDVWNEAQNVNVRAPFLLSQSFLAHMMERNWGRIINLTSIGGQWGGTLAVPYAVSKAALIGLTRSLAKLGASRGVTVNAVSPGLVGTEILAGEVGTAEYKKKVEGIPLGRIATVEEIAGVILFLAGDAAGYITGQTLNVNGGMYFG
ncbi:MAG: SDR family oxidoreductase [Bacteroidetes bacterium]|nr:SDR family oxidoreductase [Bacteroidota bacterium]